MSKPILAALSRGGPTAPIFFAVTRKRMTADGKLDGIYLVSIVPEYFTRYYSQFPTNDVTVSGLTRADGVTLARFPAAQVGSRSLPDPPLMRAIVENPQNGVTTGKSSFDGAARIIAYRKLPGQPVYVNAGVDLATVRAKWLSDMSAHSDLWYPRNPHHARPWHDDAAAYPP